MSDSIPAALALAYGTGATLYVRQAKPTVRIPARTVAECAARYAALQACQELQLPTEGLDLNR